MQTKARRQSCRTHAITTSRYSLELLCQGCAGNSNEGQASELPHARNHDEPLLVGIALPRLRRQCKRRPGVRVAARTQSRRAATRWNCSAKVAQAMQTKARRQSCRTHAITTSRYSLELLCQGCAGNANEGQASELPHARNHDEPLLVGIALPRLRRQCKRRPGVRVAARTQSRRAATRWNCSARLRRQFKRRLGVRVAARTQSRRAATRWNCSAKVAQAMQTKARRQSCRTHAITTSRYSLELLCQGCAGNSNEG